MLAILSSACVDAGVTADTLDMLRRVSRTTVKVSSSNDFWPWKSVNQVQIIEKFELLIFVQELAS